MVNVPNKIAARSLQRASRLLTGFSSGSFRCFVVQVEGTSLGIDFKE